MRKTVHSKGRKFSMIRPKESKTGRSIDLGDRKDEDQYLHRKATHLQTIDPQLEGLNHPQDKSPFDSHRGSG